LTKEPEFTWLDVILRGHKTFPKTSWAATSRWRANPKSFTVLTIGLAIFGVGEGLLFLSAIGNSPWTVLAEGVMLRTSLSLGIVTALVSMAVLLLWIPLRERPGLGTVMNVVVIAAAIDLTITLIPPPAATETAARYALGVMGVLIVGAGSALYLTTNHGPGPRDGLMTSIHNRTGIRVSRVRLTIESSVLVVGFILGGTVGVGTLIFAFGIGRAMAFWLGVIARLAPSK
jgi:uncharacterized membrane protein YczE